MKKKNWRNYTVAAFLVLSTSTQADIDIHEGMWEITNTIEISGIHMKMPETKISQCISKKKIVPRTDKKVNKYCTVSDQQINGDTVTWKMKCTNDMHSDGSVTYHGETFEGVVRASTKVPHIGTMEMTIHTSGKRTGECKKN